MIRIAAIVFALCLPAAAHAQEQQAGNAASTDTEGTFQSLVDQCDDVDALMLRARIRLQIPRATEEAASEAQKMMDNAFATCAKGDVDGAKTQLASALKVAEEGADQKLAATEEAQASAQQAAASPQGEAEGGEDGEKPWWRFW